MNVLKFGGTSVANAENINLVLNIVSDASKKERLVVVVSAFSGVTDLLVLAGANASAKDKNYKEIVSQIERKHKDAIDELIPLSEQSELIDIINSNINHLKTLLDGCYLLGELSSRTSDTILGFGELLSSQIIAKAMQQKTNKAAYKDSRELIKTNNHFGKATVNFEITNKLISEYFSSNDAQVTIIPGFIASSTDGNQTTLGRGGSDYTAAIAAAALNAAQLEIWTDVNGMFTANPKIVKQAQPIESISYQEAMELSHFGAKVLYPPTIQPVLKKNIPILIKNTFEPEAGGTLITASVIGNENPIKGISHIDKIALLTLEGSGMIGVSGSSKRLFEVLSNENINVIFITQASSEHSICIGILNSDADKARAAIDDAFEIEISQNKIDPCIVEKTSA
jgi:aspartokinase/homoserine dehydrogenase 1